jgi:hypothetical protein
MDALPNRGQSARGPAAEGREIGGIVSPSEQWNTVKQQQQQLEARGAGAAHLLVHAVNGSQVLTGWGSLPGVITSLATSCVPSHATADRARHQ